MRGSSRIAHSKDGQRCPSGVTGPWEPRGAPAPGPSWPRAAPAPAHDRYTTNAFSFFLLNCWVGREAAPGALLRCLPSRAGAGPAAEPPQRTPPHAGLPERLAATCGTQRSGCPGGQRARLQTRGEKGSLSLLSPFSYSPDTGRTVLSERESRAKARFLSSLFIWLSKFLPHCADLALTLLTY